MTRRTCHGAHTSSRLRFSSSKFLARVEKYRPVTLDDVVSHKDITGTSEYCQLRAYMSRHLDAFSREVH